MTNTFDEPEKVPGAPEREPDMVDERRPPKSVNTKESLMNSIRLSFFFL